MRNLPLEMNVLKFIGKNDNADEYKIVDAFKNTEPLNVYDALMALILNKLIERIEIGDNNYYKIIKDGNRKTT